MNRYEGQREKTIKLKARFKNLDRLREFAGRQAEACGLDDKAVYAVKLSVDEAFTNIVEHAYGGESNQKIECACKITADGLVITMRDCGRAFNPRAVPEPDLNAHLEDRNVGGLGLYFIRELMDEVHFTFAPGSGGRRQCNILRMVKLKGKTR